MADIDIDASELDDAAESVLQLGGNLKGDAREMRREEPRQMLRLIRISIAFHFDNTTGDLARLFTVTPTNRGGVISTENLGKTGGRFDHAPLALEEGNPPHPISGNPTLKFKPDSPGDYRDDLVTEDGFVIVDSVDWKPRTNPNGYGYIQDAQDRWDDEIQLTLPAKIQQSIRKAGFN